MRRQVTTSRIYRDTSKRLKVVGAVTGVAVADLLERLVVPGLARLEREHLGRYREVQEKAHGRPLG